MSTFWRLRKKDHFIAAIEIKKSIPELKNIDSGHIQRCLYETDLEFYYSEKVKPKLLIRLTLPLALMAMGLLFILLPVNYIVTGYWGYKWTPLTNWLRSLGF